MKKLLVDLQALQGVNSQRGIGRYVREFIAQLCQSGPDLQVDFFFNGSSSLDSRMIAKFVDSLEGEHQTHVWYPPKVPVEISAQIIEISLEAFYLKLNPDLILIPSLFEGQLEPIFTKVSEHIPTAVVVHDLIPLVHKEQYLQSPNAWDWYQSKMTQLELASHLLCVSRHTSSDVSRLLRVEPQAIRVIGTGNSLLPEFSTGLRSPSKQQTLLYVGGLDWRKNIDGLLAAFSLSRARQSGLKLRIVCSIDAEQTKRMLRFASSLGIRPSQLEFTGFVSDAELAQHYQRAMFCIFPSLYEGFGLPVLEALAFGKAVIVSNNTSLVEIQTNPIAQFDPGVPTDIARKIDDVYFDSALLKKLELEAPNLAVRHSWANVVQTFKGLVSNTETVKSKTPANQKPRLAFVTPLPPSKSGIAFHSHRILPALAKYYDITVIDSVNSNQRFVCGSIPVQDSEWFKNNAGNADRVVYQIGNSFWHQEAVELLESHPGLVVIHDYFLGGLLEWLEGARGDSNTWREALFLNHGYSAIAEPGNRENRPALSSLYPANLQIQQSALATLFHSERSVKLNERWAFVPGDPGLQALIPLVPTIEYVSDSTGDDELLSVHGFGPEDFVIATFGFTTENKGHLEIAEAISKIRSRTQKRIIFACVGDHSSPAFAELLQTRVRQLGLDDIYVSTGWTSDREYQAWLRRANLVIQLRKTMFGESSAALLDAMSYGNTVLTNRGLAAKSIGEFLKVLDFDFTVNELSQALLELVESAANPDAVKQQALDYVSQNHSPESLAARYRTHIEDAYESGAAKMFGYLAQAQLENFPVDDIEALALSLADSVAPTPRVQQIFIDVSELGAQVKGFPKALATEMLMVDEPGLVVIPVYFDSDLKLFAPDHHFARSVFDADSWESGYGDHIQAWHGDVLVDLNSKATIGADTVLARMQASGVNVVSIRQDKSMVTKSGRELVDLLRDQKQAAPLG